jgi:hypothetical protein
MITVILTNCAMLAAYEPLDMFDRGARNQVINVTEPIFTAIFTFEAVVKIIALDIFGKPNGYLSDGWNWCVLGLFCRGSFRSSRSDEESLKLPDEPGPSTSR